VTTAFARIVIILFFLRAGLGSAVLPPNAVILGLAVVLTWLVMAPVASELGANVLMPLWQGQISPAQAALRSERALRVFMAAHVSRADYEILARARAVQAPAAQAPFEVLAAAFALSELRTGFLAGLLIYLPFLAVDVLVYLVTAALGPATFSPQLFALPVKVAFFVMAEGWRLLFQAVVHGYLGGG
jgi:flagellar biosynthetic protein FliP